jgi:cell division septation protein DedD
VADSGERKQDEKGLSARYLVMVFLMGVAACAVFFSLGFLVGYNERSSKTAGVTEQVTPLGVIPPTVNPPLETVPVMTKESPSGGSTAAQKSMGRTSSKAEKESKSTAARGAQISDVDIPPPAASTANSRTGAAPPAAAGKSVQVGMGFTVQVAASRDKQDAEKLVKELKSRGYAVFLVLPEYANVGDNLFRVQVGPYASREEAQTVRDKIAKEGFKPFIRR